MDSCAWYIPCATVGEIYPPTASSEENVLTYLFRATLVPLGGLLVGMSDPQESALAEGAAKELESHRQVDAVAVGESAL
jgi:hypothetical protein